MAVELCSEVSSSISPRISFSHDFSQSDFIPVEQQQKQHHPFGSDPCSDHLIQNTDFDFCVTESFDLESLPAADEFFSYGRILPTEVKTSKSNNNNNNNSLLKKKDQLLLSPHPPPPLPPQSVVNNNNHHHHHYNGYASSSSSNFKNLKRDHGCYKEGKCFNNDEACDNKHQSNGSSKSSFWSFKRSSSCGNGYRRSSLCPLPLLSRSNSTGSTSPEVKRNSMSKEGHNHSNSKQNSSQKHSPSFTRCSSPSVGPNIYQKPPINYSKNGSYGNNVRVSPALNVHSANLFGLGSIFSNNSRDKSNKKK